MLEKKSNGSTGNTGTWNTELFKSISNTLYLKYLYLIYETNTHVLKILPNCVFIFIFYYIFKF